MAMQSIEWNGKPISKPGMYSGVSMEDYHRHDICDAPSISSSGLRRIMRDSPAHFFNEWRGNPNRVEEDEEKKRHFIVGRATHHLLLGQPNFRKLFVMQPDEYEDEKTGELKKWNYNANACKRWRDAQRAAGLTTLKPDEVEQIKGMALELGKHPIIKAGALNGRVERSIFFKDKATGIWIKVRPDSVPGDSADYVDYKTTTSVKRSEIEYAIGEFGYHQQGALIREAAKIVFEVRATFTLVFQEKKRPHCVRVVTLRDEDMDLGMRQNRRGIETFARCLESGHWPGPGGEREDAEHMGLTELTRKYMLNRLDADRED